MELTTALGLAVGLLSLLYLLYKRRSPSNVNAPPSYSGPWYLPFLGCGIEFGKEPLFYIQKAREKLGPVFTLYMTGKNMTFVTTPEDIDVFFSSKKLDFQHFVQESVKNTSGVSPESFWRHHTTIHDTMKGYLARGQLSAFSGTLHKAMVERFDELPDGEHELNGLVRETLYFTVMENLFGPGVLPTRDKETFHKLVDEFVLYDDKFEYGSQLGALNHLLMRDWVSSRTWLLDMFRRVTPPLLKSCKSGNTMFERLLSTVDEPHAPNYGLLLLWAALANAIPITFWTLGFIMTTPGLQERVEDAANAITDLADGGVPDEGDLEREPLIRNCVMEAIRLRAPGIIGREVREPLDVGGKTVPVGHMLVMSPYWAHRNPVLFPDPETFNPDRWGRGGAWLEGFVAFGGGRYQCPGRWFALLEIQLFIVTLFRTFRMKPLGPLPRHAPLHLVGAQQPVADFRVAFSRL